MKDEKKFKGVANTNIRGEELVLYDIYQDTINQYFREYLLNFNYFAQVMGKTMVFLIIDAEEAQSKNLLNGTGLFSELYSRILMIAIWYCSQDD